MKQNQRWIMIILLLIIGGLVSYILYDKGLIFKEKIIEEIKEPEIENKEDSIKNDKENSEEEYELIHFYKEKLRKKIPTIEYCNNYLFKQYNGSIFYATDLTEEDKTSTFNSCQGALGVFYDEEKIEWNEEEIYIYDYVLLYSMEGEFDRNTGIDYSYGKSYNRINLEKSLIENDKHILTKNNIRKYGQLYKYTFKKDTYGQYAYYSTEAVK